MRFRLAWAIPVVSWVLASSGLADHAALVPAPDAIPDLTQTDPKGGFAGGGRSFCGPVAVSNSFMAIFREDLKWEEVSHYDLVNKLASQSFMNTDAEKGTNVKQLLRGVDLFLQDRGEKDYYLKFQGWRRHDTRHRTGVHTPQLRWIRNILARGGAVWLNVGWYQKTEEEGVYRRLSGHWVTAVGYGADQSGNPQPDVLIIHDPAPRAGQLPSRQFVTMTRFESGKLTGPMHNLPQPARNLYRMEGGMHIKRGADLAILDGAAGLVLNRQAESGQGKAGEGE